VVTKRGHYQKHVELRTRKVEDGFDEMEKVQHLVVWRNIKEKEEEELIG